MNRVLLAVPTMWADHHVSRVVEALQRLAGVSRVEASAARWEVMVEFDPTATSVPTIEAALRAAGYPSTRAQEI